MAFERYIDGFDQCEPPICDDGDYTVEITEKTCADFGWLAHRLIVTWVVNDPHGGTFTVTSSVIKWSVNSTDLDQSSSAMQDSSPFSAAIDLTGYTGIVYLQAEVVIAGTTYRSTPIDTFDINDCVDFSDEMVAAVICNHGCDPPQDSPHYAPLWLKEQMVSPVPMYLNIKSFAGK